PDRPGANRGRGGHRFASRAGPHSHPGRVLLRVRGGTFWSFAVAAPPGRRTAPVRTANEAGTYLRPGRPPLAPRAGAPTGSGGHVLVFCCRSTAGSPDRPGANRERSGHVFAPGQAPIRTRGGCSYGFGAGFSFVVGAPPRCEARTKRAQRSAPGRPHSHPGRVLLRFVGGFGFCCRSTAPVRTANEAGTDLRPGQAPFAPGAGAPTGSGAGFGFHDDPYQESKLYVAGPG